MLMEEHMISAALPRFGATGATKRGTDASCRACTNRAPRTKASTPKCRRPWDRDHWRTYV